MLYNINYNNFNKHLHKLISNKISFTILYLNFFIKNLFIYKLLKSNYYNYINFIELNKIYNLYINIFKVNNLFLANIFINYFTNNKLSTIALPKKYKLYTLLRSPHIDKRSREQFHIIENKLVLYSPLILNLSNFSLLNIVFNFKIGHNMVILKKKIV